MCDVRATKILQQRMHREMSTSLHRWHAGSGSRILRARTTISQLFLFVVLIQVSRMVDSDIILASAKHDVRELISPVVCCRWTVNVDFYTAIDNLSTNKRVKFSVLIWSMDIWHEIYMRDPYSWKLSSRMQFYSRRMEQQIRTTMVL